MTPRHLALSLTLASAASCCLEIAGGSGPSTSGSVSQSSTSARLETSATGTTTGSGTSSAGSSSGSATSSGSSTGAQPIGTLWFGGSAALDATTLAHSGTVSFDHTCPLPGSSGEPMIQGPEAIDGDRNLWALCPGVALCVWTPDQQRQSCTSAPSRVIHLDTLDVLLSAIAFDSHGNLWGTMPFPGSNWRGPVATGVAGYRASDLVPGVPVEPTWFLYPSCQAYSLCDPSSLAFDAEGDLWVGDLEVLLGYSPASLMAATYSGVDGESPPADLQESDTSHLGVSFDFLAFDRSGNLWFIAWGPGGGGGQLLELSQAQLQADLFLPGGFGGFSSDAGTIEATGPLAFDSSGNLWFGGSEQDGEGFELDGGANLFRLTPQSLADGGYPDISLTVPGAPWASFAFSPIPAGLPIQP